MATSEQQFVCHVNGEIIAFNLPSPVFVCWVIMDH